MHEVNEKLAQLSLAKRAVLNQRLHGKKAGLKSEASILRRAEPGPVLLSFAQERLWFLDQFEPDNIVYNLPLGLRLRGPLDAAVLQRCLGEIVRRHEALRTRFEATEGQPMQVIDPFAGLGMPLVDLNFLPQKKREAEAMRLCREEARRPFDLKSDLMLRAVLYRLSPTEHILFLNMHHIVSDGWSMGVMFSELKALYAAFLEGRASPLPDLPAQYADYAVWQRQWLRGEVLENQLSYWRKQLEGAPGRLELPADRPRPPVLSYRGAIMRAELPASLAAALRELSRTEGTTLFMTLLAVFQVLLHRYTGQDDMVVGSAVAGRNRTEVESQIGFFVNTLALRMDLSGRPTFRELLRRTRETAVAAFAHQDLPFEKLVEALRVQRDTSHSPLFQVMFVLQNAERETAQLANVEVTPLPIHTETSKFDVTFSIREIGDALEAELEYNTDLFDAATISRMLAHYRMLLDGVVAEPGQPIANLPLLTEEERHQLLVEWNQEQRDYPRDKCIHEIFEEQAELTPDAVAVVCGEGFLSYDELNHRAERVAQHLRILGVGPNIVVGLQIERSLEIIIGLLGILKAGGAYWALEDNLPQERLRMMLTDARPRVLLYRSVTGKAAPDLSFMLPADLLRIVDIEELLESIPPELTGAVPRVTADDLAYVNYTSGSTGQPKGVLVPHRGVVRLVKENDYASLGPDETILHSSPLSFDASTFEVWGALLNGGRVMVMPPGRPTLSEIGDAIRRHHVTTAWFTAGLFHLMVDERLDDLKSLRQLLAGGDVLSPEHVRQARRALPGCRIINGYGPTENTTFTCCHTVEDERDLVPSVPIGRPIAHTQVYLLDESLQPVPVGVPGELYAGGDGLALGYLNQPELTAQKFIADPFSGEEGARLYRTGDRARWRPDGTIEYLGRIDQQVKIRGFRVELGEIEEALNLHPEVSTSAVVARKDAEGDKRLVAYVVGRGDVVDSRSLYDFLRATLPDYMVPQVFVTLKTLPLTSNGKVDRRALPEPVEAKADEGELATANTPTEKMMADLWRDVLGLKDVGVDDDFFEMGGHSLLAVRLISKIRKSFDYRLSVQVFYQNSTIRKLATVLDEQHGESKSTSSNESEVVLIPFQTKGGESPLFFQHGDWTGGGIYCGRLSQRLGEGQPFYALPPYRSEKQTLLTMEEMARYHVAVIQEHTPHGPYLIGGYCVGATVAMEIARQLTVKGEQVERLFLVDPPLSNNRLHRAFWPVVDKMGGFLKWDLWGKIVFFNKSLISLERWFARPASGKMRSLWRRLGLLKTVEPGPSVDEREQGEGEEEGEILKGLDYAIYVLAYYLYKVKPLSVPVTLYFPEETPPSRRNARRARKIFPILTVETVPGNHRTCIIKHAFVLADDMKKTLDDEK